MAALYPAQGVVISVKPCCQLRKVLIIWKAVERALNEYFGKLQAGCRLNYLQTDHLFILDKSFAAD
ncbi:MAG: hypothetical protein ACI9IO_001652 [Cyanobium sp.]|jgi:hypothetical protein